MKFRLDIFPFNNTQNWLASFAAMENLQPKLIVPGHVKVCDLEAAINSLNADVYRSLRNFDSLHRFNASNVYLELEKP